MGAKSEAYENVYCPHNDCTYYLNHAEKKRRILLQISKSKIRIRCPHCNQFKTINISDIISQRNQEKFNELVETLENRRTLTKSEKKG